ncbi:Pre-mRNA cleavage complex II protein Clp1-domain-containing protein [Lipomyces arxii]|uniref:Pre-mRNA cleavage complex II protein Clp1-domain-containing protein n=1 Tax=Lipomyces arxii TaxID=56418 RepID=UPI0034CF3D8D
MKRTSAKAFLSAVATQKSHLQEDLNVADEQEQLPVESNDNYLKTTELNLVLDGFELERDNGPVSPVDNDYEIKYISASNSDQDYDVLISDTEIVENSKNFEIIDLDENALVSSFTPSSDNVLSAREITFYGLKRDQTIVIHGQYSFKVLTGSASLYGTLQLPSADFQNVFAPSTHPFPVIKAAASILQTPSESVVKRITELLPPDFAGSYTSLLNYPTILALRSLKTGLEPINPVKFNFKIQHVSSYEVLYRAPQPVSVLQTTDEWDTAINEVVRASSPRQVTVICGSKSAGKSTFARLLLNAMISSTKDAVAFFDLDPGQPEFGPPGVLSLNVLASPVFGPPYSHGALASSVKALHFGFTTPRDAPEAYILLIRSLMEYYVMELSGTPMIVNTTGWTKGYGVELLGEILKIVHATDTVYIGTSLNHPDLDTNLELGPLLQKSSTVVREISPATTANARQSAADARMTQMLSYFYSRDRDEWDFDTPLTHTRPYVVPYTQELILEILAGDGVADEHILAVLNGTVVGLSVVAGKLPVRVTQGMALATRTASVPEAEISCLGLAIVRAVDRTAQTLHILTPVPVDIIRAHIFAGKQILLTRGRLELPLAAAWPGDQLGVCGRPWKDVPYLSMDSATDGERGDKLGQQSLRVRRNVMRRGQQLRA